MKRGLTARHEEGNRLHITRLRVERDTFESRGEIQTILTTINLVMSKMTMLLHANRGDSEASLADGDSTVGRGRIHRSDGQSFRY